MSHRRDPQVGMPKEFRVEECALGFNDYAGYGVAELMRDDAPDPSPSHAVPQEPADVARRVLRPTRELHSRALCSVSPFPRRRDRA